MPGFEHFRVLNTHADEIIHNLRTAVIDAGAAQVAVIGDLLATGNPQERIAAYSRALM